MRGTVALLATAVLSTAGAHLSAVSDTATRTVTAHAQVSARSSLIVSNEVLQFLVLQPGQPAVASIDFVAGVRTHAAGEVVLTVETATAEAFTPGMRLTLAGNPDDILTGAIAIAGPTVAGRWIGSGRRIGRITFALHGAAVGTYAVSVRFVLSAA